MRIYLAIGDLSKFRIRMFEELNVERVLVSYADIQGSADFKLPFKDIMLDSGAYGAENRGVKISLEAYTLWLQLYLDTYPQITSYVSLDDLSSPETSEYNLLYMESEGLHPMPVYHYGEPTSILDELCANYEYVGLGGVAFGVMSNQMQKYWEWCHQRYKDNKFHIFGIGTMIPFFNYQPYSIDSNSWTAGDRFMHIAGYKDGLPLWLHLSRKDTGWELFFTHKELFSANIRAMIDWEKLEWLKNIKGGGTQEWLI